MIPWRNTFATRVLSPHQTALKLLSGQYFSKPYRSAKNRYNYDILWSFLKQRCDNKIDWCLIFVFQLSAFSNLRFDNRSAMINTYRPVQPRYGREVYRSGSYIFYVSTMLFVSSVLTTLYVHTNWFMDYIFACLFICYYWTRKCFVLFDLLYPICIRPVVHFGLLLNYYSFLDQHDGKKKKMNE